MNILVVDDHECLLEIIVTLLEGMGYTTKSATSGEAAICEIMSSDCKIDVIVSDLEMPKMSGIELYKQIKTRFQISPPFILFTANIEVNRHQDLGFHAIINKPNFQTLMDCLSNLERHL